MTRTIVHTIPTLPPERALGPWDPRWPEFIVALCGPDFLNVQDSGCRGITWSCDGTFGQALALLGAMKGYDAESSLRLWSEMGARCSCTLVPAGQQFRERAAH